ncbi:MAG: hypothetical protein SGCHY_004148 [Lobulomycetales sp.]
MKLIFTVLIALLVAGCHACFTARTCPKAESLQSDYVAANFSLKAFAGVYYQIAYKDVVGGGVNEKFSLKCLGREFGARVKYEQIENTRGQFILTVKRVPVKFVEIIVDVGQNLRSGQYDWIVAFQCKRNWLGSGSGFYTFHFYSRTPTPEYYHQMLAIAQERFPEFMEGRDIHIVDHQNCDW